jgi:hypothetical protein
MEDQQTQASEAPPSEEPSFASDILGLALMPGFTLIGIIIAFAIFVAPIALIYYLFFSK